MSDTFSALAEAQTDAEIAALLRRWAYMTGETDSDTAPPPTGTDDE